MKMILGLLFAAGLFAQKTVIIPSSVVPLNGTPTPAMVTRFATSAGEIDLVEALTPDTTVAKPVRNSLGAWVLSALAVPPTLIQPTSAGWVLLNPPAAATPNLWCQTAADTTHYFPSMLRITVTVTSPQQTGTSGTVSWPPQIFYTLMQPGPQPTTGGTTVSTFPTWNPTACGTTPGISLAPSYLTTADPALINFTINSVEILAVW